jgi:hypothetical protein
MQFEVELPYVDYVMKTIFNPIAERICTWWDFVTSPSFDPSSPETWAGVHWATPIRTFLPESTEYYKPNYWEYRCGLRGFDELTDVPDFYPEL